MAYDLNPGALLGVLSGLAMAGLGLLVFRLRPRSHGSVLFSLFAALWGAQVVAANMGELSADAATSAPWGYAFIAFLLPLYAALLLFLLAWPTRPPGPRYRALALMIAVPAFLLELLYLAAPALFIQGAVDSPRGPPTLLAGPLLPALQVLENVGVFVLALLLASQRMRRAESPVQREKLGLIVAAFLTYLSYRSGDLAHTLMFPGALASSPADFALRAGVEALALASVLAWVVAALRDPRMPWRDVFVAGGLLPLAAGVAEVFVARAGVVGFSTVGLWRLAMVGLFAYAIARYRLFDVEVRLQAIAPFAAYVASCGLGLLVLWGAAGSALAQVPALGLLASAAIVAACAPAVRLTTGALAASARQREDPQYLLRRKIDVYRSVLEEAQAKGAGEETEQAFLSDLRRRLGISQSEHRVLLLVLESERRRAQSQAPASPERFRVIRELGRGSAGRVVLARDVTLDRDVVLKQPLVPWVLDTEGRNRFLQEARLAARIKHPHVVSVYEVLPDVDPPMLVLEYVEGGSLEQLLERGRLPLDRALAIEEDLLAGLAAVHRAGIVHRDVKPANVLLDGEGRAKVTDFGIAHPPRELAVAGTLAAASAQPGSLAYMSPEQARGDDVDARSDLYAAGAVLYNMLAGQHYIDVSDGSDLDIRKRIQVEQPRLPAAGVPAAAEAVLRRALAKRPQDRYASAEAMAKALRAAVAPRRRAPR